MKSRFASFPGLLCLVAVAALCASAGNAAGKTTIAPGSYSGFLSFQGTASSTETVSFTVAHNRSKVKNLRLNPFIPSSCGSGGPPPVETSKSAKINKKGKFTGTVNELAANGSVSVTGTVTGKFVAGGRVKGQVRSELPIAPQCNAQFTFTAQR